MACSVAPKRSLIIGCGIADLGRATFLATLAVLVALAALVRLRTSETKA